MKRIKWFINLTNGIDIFDTVAAKYVSRKGYAFIRLQSTAAEQTRWDFIIRDLDNNLLMELALGSECIIIDSSRNRTSRAQWQIIPWIKYVLNRKWLSKREKVYCRSHNVTHYFDKCYRLLSNEAHKKLRYYRKFLNTSDIKIDYVDFHTDHDGKYSYFKQLILKQINEENTNPIAKI